MLANTEINLLQKERRPRDGRGEKEGRASGPKKNSDVSMYQLPMKNEIIMYWKHVLVKVKFKKRNSSFYTKVQRKEQKCTEPHITPDTGCRQGTWREF